MTDKPLSVAVNAHNRHMEKQAYRDPNDFYIEDPWCAELLLAALDWSGTALDPACGSGNVVTACRAHGLDTTASDLMERTCPGCTPRIDFTLPGAYPPRSFDHVISNPPFYKGWGTQAFVERGLVVARQRVAVLAPLPFLAGQERGRWYAGLPLSHVFVLSARSSMPPGVLLLAGLVEAKGGKEDYAWYVFSHGHTGPWQGAFLAPPPRPRRTTTRKPAGGGQSDLFKQGTKS